MTLHKIVSGFRRGMIGRRTSRGKCWMISHPLAGYLSILGHECKVVEGVVDRRTAERTHVWVELADGRIVDATADQFSTKRRPMPKVYIGPRPKWYEVIPHAQLINDLKHAEKSK